MKNKNKISMLAAIGITLSVVTIVVRVDVASATGSYGSGHSRSWSSIHDYHTQHAYHGGDRPMWSEDEDTHDHSHHFNFSDGEEDCTCQADGLDDAGSQGSDDSSQDDATDGETSNDDVVNSEDSESGMNENDCQDSGSQSENGPEESTYEHSADDLEGHPTGDQSEGPTQTPAEDGQVNGDSDSSADEDNDSEPPVSQPGQPTQPAQPSSPAIELSVDTKVKVNDGAFVDAETDGDAAAGQVGGSATWQITVTPDQVDPADSRTIKVEWVAPDNVEVIGSTVDNGTYDGSVWTIPVTKLPAVLTVSTTIAKPGLGASNAIISKISCEEIIANGNGFCDFNDGVANNNANPAGVIASPAVTPNANSGAGAQSGSAGTGTLGASTGSQGNEGAVNSGVLGANTTRGGQGGEGVVHAKETDANGVLGATTARPESVDQGMVLAAASTGALANTGVSSNASVLMGLLVISGPLALATVSYKKR